MTDAEYLTLEDLLTIVERLDAQIRDLGLLASAAARPRTTVFGEDAYPDLGTKAAALMHSVAGDHPLVDGNKRPAWIATRFVPGPERLRPRPHRGRGVRADHERGRRPTRRRRVAWGRH